VVWTAEFGQTPYSQSGDGRDPNPWGFTSWLAGGAIKAGIPYGETDAIGLRAISKAVDAHDLNATILNQLGLNQVILTFLHEGALGATYGGLWPRGEGHPGVTRSATNLGLWHGGSCFWGVGERENCIQYCMRRTRHASRGTEFRAMRQSRTAHRRA
jgi:hypothetical protein